MWIRWQTKDSCLFELHAQGERQLSFCHVILATLVATRADEASVLFGDTSNDDRFATIEGISTSFDVGFNFHG